MEQSHHFNRADRPVGVEYDSENISLAGGKSYHCLLKLFQKMWEKGLVNKSIMLIDLEYLDSTRKCNRVLIQLVKCETSR